MKATYSVSDANADHDHGGFISSPRWKEETHQPKTKPRSKPMEATMMMTMVHCLLVASSGKNGGSIAADSVILRDNKPEYQLIADSSNSNNSNNNHCLLVDELRTTLPNDDKSNASSSSSSSSSNSNNNNNNKIGSQSYRAAKLE